MSDKIFLDSNIIIYAYDKSDPERQKKAQQILKDVFQNENGILSPQVLSEFFVVVTRKIKNPLSSIDAKTIISSLSFLQVEEIDLTSVKRAIETHIQFKISYWDSLIISTAERAVYNIILSEDLNHGQIINGVEINNPFV